MSPDFSHAEPRQNVEEKSMTQMAIRGVVPPSFPQSVARASLENKIVLLMLACHSTQVLSYWLEMGSMGQIVGACGAMMAIGLSLLSARAMFVLLLGLCYIPLAGPVLASLRAYVLVYVVLLARLCVSPSVYALLGGKSPGPRHATMVCHLGGVCAF